MAPQNRYDVYDDTGGARPRRSSPRTHSRSSRASRSSHAPHAPRSPHASRESREPRSSRESRASRPSGRGGAARSSRALAVRDEDPPVAHDAFGRDAMAAWGAPTGPLFGPMQGLLAGAFGGMDRAWGELERAARDGREMPGGSHFYYESTTQTMGEDGRVRRETVRTRPGADGRLETKRVVREEDGRETVTRSPGELPPSPFSPGGLFADLAEFGRRPLPAPPARVEEISEEEERRARRRARRRGEGSSDDARSQRVIVEEPVDDYELDVGDGAQHRAQSHRSFFDRARAWRGGRA